MGTMVVFGLNETGAERLWFRQSNARMRSADAYVGCAQNNLTDGIFGIVCTVVAEKQHKQRIRSNHLNSPIPFWVRSTMLKKFSLTDKLLFVASFLSLIFSEILYFQGHKLDAIFIGIWVPSILAFGIYLKLIGSTKNE